MNKIMKVKIIQLFVANLVNRTTIPYDSRLNLNHFTASQLLLRIKQQFLTLQIN